MVVKSTRLKVLTELPEAAGQWGGRVSRERALAAERVRVRITHLRVRGEVYLGRMLYI